MAFFLLIIIDFLVGIHHIYGIIYIYWGGGHILLLVYYVSKLSNFNAFDE